MDKIENYVKPELIIVAVVLYFLGIWFKQSEVIKDKYIPLLLGGIGILFCGIWIIASGSFENGQDVLLAVFASITQGILVAGLSTYVNQCIKQNKKEE